jgi:cysteine-rich repeat protein
MMSQSKPYSNMRSASAWRAAIWLTFVVGLAGASAAACSTTTADSKLCTPGKEYFCRCSNPLEEGSRTCNDDGAGYAACTPCDGTGPIIDEDGGRVDDVQVACGNKRIEPGENCDDGNRIDTDLCSANCVPQGVPTGSTCPALPVYVWDSFELSGETSGTSSFQANASCDNASGSTSPERLYEITPNATGTLVVTTSAASFDHMIYARRDCGVPASEKACVNTVTGNGGESARFAVTAKQKVWVVVDGVRQQAGTYSIKFVLEPSSSDAGVATDSGSVTDARVTDAKRD